MRILVTGSSPGRTVRVRLAALWLFAAVMAFIVVVVPRDVSTSLADWVTRMIHLLAMR